MNVSSPSAPAKLSLQGVEQTNVYVEFNTVQFESWSPKTALIPATTPWWWLSVGSNIQSQISHDPKPPVSMRPINQPGSAPRLLCRGTQGCTFAIPLCCWKNKPWKQESLDMKWFSSVLWQFFVVWFLSSWLSKAYVFKYSVEKLYLLWS